MKQIAITDLGSEGEGVGSDQGLKVFVEGALPGEIATVEFTQIKKNYALASLHSLHTTSPHRVTPPCPLFGDCGGCQIMHLSYEEQLNVKRRRVEAAFKRIGHLEVVVEPCVPSPSSLGYRNKIQLPLLWEQGERKIGFFRKGSHEIVPLTSCKIQSSEGEEILKEILPYITDTQIRYLLIRAARHTKEALVILVTEGKSALNPFPVPSCVKGVVENVNPSSSRNTILGPKWRPLCGRPYIYETLLGKRFKIGAGAFFQVNTEQAESLYQEAIHLGQVAGKRVIDAYCGVGTLSLLIGETAHSVVGIEEFPDAIANAKENALLNSLPHCTFLAGKTENLLSELPAPDVLFLNPPRKGCESSVLDYAAKRKIPKLIYISCDPATLARDASILVSSGYRIEKVQPFDMFPQTMHVETLVSFVK